MRSFTLSGIASFTLQNGKFFVAASFASHANESRASQELCRRRMKRVMRGESENVVICCMVLQELGNLV